MIKGMKRIMGKSNEKGSVLIFVAISLVALIGFAGLSIDVGMTVYQKSVLQNAVDAAALAAAQELPDSTSNAINVATEYLDLNEGLSKLTSYDVTFSDSNRKVNVEAKRDIQYFFAKVIGFQKGEISARAAAIKASAEIVSGNIRPFGVDDKEYVKNQQVTLRFGSGDGDNGNFGALDFGKKHKAEGYQVSLGADFFEEMILNGSYVDYGLYDQLPTLTGIMAQKTLKSMQELVEEQGVTQIIIPLISSVDGGPLDLTGKTDIMITGFAAFDITEYRIAPDKKNGKGTGQIEIVGKFIEYKTVGQADLDITNTGVTAVSLVE